MVQYRIDLIVDGRKVKEVTKDFETQEKSIDKLSKSFEGMEKISLATAATQLKMIGNVKSLSTLIQGNLITPVLKLGGAFREIQQATSENINTVQRGRHIQTRVANILERQVLPVTQEIVAAQQDGVQQVQRTDKGLKGVLKAFKGMKAAAAAIVLTGLFAFGAASPLLQARMSMMSFQFEQLGIIVGDALAPALEVLSLGIQVIIDLWNSLSPELQAATKDMILTTAIVLTLALAFTVLTAVFGALATVTAPVWIIIVAIAAALALLFIAWETNFGGFRDNAIAGFRELLAAFDTFLDALEKMTKGDFMGGFVDVFLGGLRFVIAYMLTIPKILVNTFGNAFSDITRGIFDPFLRLLGGIGAVIEGILTLDMGKIDRGLAEISTAFGASEASTQEMYQEYAASRGGGFAHGGIIPGSGAVGILAHGGEMVLNRSQQESLFSMLNGVGGTNITNNNQRSSNINININVEGGGNMGTETAEELRNALIGRISSL